MFEKRLGILYFLVRLENILLEKIYDINSDQIKKKSSQLAI